MLSGIVRAVDLYGSEPNGRSLVITIVVYNNAMLATKTRAKAEGLAQKG